MTEGAPAPGAEQSYRGALAASYVLAPLLALGVGGVLSEVEADDSLAVAAGSAMFLTPAIVHAANDQAGQGLASFALMFGSTAVGTVLGSFVGYNLDSMGCDPAEDSDSCDFAGIQGFVVGALLGGVLGYTAFAIYDVSENGAAPLDQPSTDHASLRLWLSPLAAPRRAHTDTQNAFAGVQLGATLEM